MAEPTLDLDGEMRLHMSESFPESVERGEVYGEVDAVMIGADIYGWAGRTASLTPLDRARLQQAAAELAPVIHGLDQVRLSRS